MAALLTKKLISLRIHLSLASLNHNLTALTPLFHFSTQIQQKEDLPFIAQFLISSFGFSRDRALRVSDDKNLAPIKSPDRPESVVRFFKDYGLTDTDIQSLISWYPQILSRNVEKTLKPRFNELVTAGFGGNTFIQLIKSNPSALARKATLPVLQFWKRFVHNNEEALLKLIKSNQGLMHVDINKNIIPRINLLREYGLSDQQICMLLMQRSGLILRSLDSIKLLLEKTESFGFQIRSGMFVPALRVVASLKNDTIQKKVEFFKSTYNWSSQDVNLAIRKCPNILVISEENVKSTMDFLIKKVGFEPRSVALQPVILTLSLKKRLVPRHYVINVLNSKGVKINCSFYSVFLLSEKKFVEKFILPYKEEVPELEDSYAAFSDGKMPN